MKKVSESRKEAEEIIAKIQSEFERAQQTIQTSLNKLKEATEVKKGYQKLIPIINRTIANANIALAKLKEDKDRITRLVALVENFHNKKYVPLVEKINNPETGLNARIKQGNQFERELKEVKENYKKQIELIKQLVVDSESKLKEVKKIEVSLREVEKKILDQEVTVKEQRAKIEEASLKVEAANKHILSSEKIILEKEKEIGELYKKSNSSYEQINSWYEEAKKTLKKIQDIYQIAAGTGLGGEFDKRRKVLDGELKSWGRQLFIGTTFLFAIIVGLFILQLYSADVNWDISRLKFDTNFYVRFLITSPIIFYIGFVTAEYSITKSLLEKYSFKTVLSLSIEAHINLLTNIEKLQGKDNLEKITNFILDGFGKIYLEPDHKAETHQSKRTLEDILKTVKALVKKD